MIVCIFRLFTWKVFLSFHWAGFLCAPLLHCAKVWSAIKFCSMFVVVVAGCFVWPFMEIHVSKWIYPFVPHWRAFFAFQFWERSENEPKRIKFNIHQIRKSIQKWTPWCVCVHVKKTIDTDNDDRWEKKSNSHICPFDIENVKLRNHYQAITVFWLDLYQTYDDEMFRRICSK